MAKYEIETFIGKKSRKPYWRIRHQNGNILCTSEQYKNDIDCIKIARNLGKAAGFKVINGIK